MFLRQSNFSVVLFGKDETTIIAGIFLKEIITKKRLHKRKIPTEEKRGKIDVFFFFLSFIWTESRDD